MAPWNGPSYANLCAGDEGYLQLSNFSYTELLVDAVQRVPYCGGTTNTSGGLRVARSEIFSTAREDRPAVPDVVVLITDGNPNREVDKLDDEVRRIKSRGIRIIGVLSLIHI